MVVFKTKFLTIRNILGFVIAYTGVAIIIINGNSLEGVEPLGDFLAFGAAIMFAIYSVIMEKSKESYHLIQKTRKVFIYGFIVLIVIVLFSGESFSSIQMSLPLGGSMLYLGIVASSLAFIMWNDAINMLGPVRTNLYIYLVPVITTVFAFLILNERITWLSVLGTVGILIGLYLSEQVDEEEQVILKVEDNL